MWQTQRGARLAAVLLPFSQNPRSVPVATSLVSHEVNPAWFKLVGRLLFPLLGISQGMNMRPSSDQWNVSGETIQSYLPGTNGVPRTCKFRYKLEKYQANQEMLVVQIVRGSWVGALGRIVLARKKGTCKRKIVLLAWEQPCKDGRVGQLSCDLQKKN